MTDRDYAWFFVGWLSGIATVLVAGWAS